MKTHLTFRVLFVLFLGFVPSVFATPLKELLLAFSDTQVIGSKVDWTAYRSIKGVKLGSAYKSNRQGYINTRLLGKFELSVTEDAKSGRRLISMSSPKPSKRQKLILETELGAGTVFALKDCRGLDTISQQSYEIRLPNSRTVYVDSDANYSFYPYMSPLYTQFEFYSERPKTWKC